MTPKTITALKQQKRNPQRVNVFLNGEFAFGLAKIVAAWLKVGEGLSEEKIVQLHAKDEVETAYQRGLNFLSYRSRSVAEVQRNLEKHGLSEDAIGEVLERLIDKQLLDDEKFALDWVDNRGTFRPRGRFALRVELRQKGIQDSVIEHVLKDLDEDALARRAAEKKLRQFSRLNEKEFRKKLSAYLSRRGFSYEIVTDVCKQAWKTAKHDDTIQSATDIETRI
ncbi:MAG: RecX family transcriptional regulator [Chloroflexi bacterium]|nr:RecX family transcriptional regulator [Chloroflexota bacterium]MQC26506.1 RecX family transcriptional regulator [Chloroflexota bacterium]